MICRWCAEAGDYMVKCAKNPSKGEIKVARALHTQCVGCDCQHQLPREPGKARKDD